MSPGYLLAAIWTRFPLTYLLMLEHSKHAKRISLILWDKNSPPAPMNHFLKLHNSTTWQNAEPSQTQRGWREYIPIVQKKRRLKDL